MNMRKIIAVLSAVLMLCAIVPASVFAAPGDVILQGNFDDGSVIFSGNATVEDGVLHWDSSTANWAHLTKGITVAKNTDYVVSFKMKSNLTHKVSVKFMLHDWATEVAGEKVAPTSEWADYSVVLNSGDNTSILFMMQTSVNGSAGQQFYFDDFKIAEYEDPATIGQIVNGNFEDGTANWKTDSSASLYSADAYEGSNSLKLANTGYYASAATQTISVKANTDYELVWYSKRLSGTGAFNVILCQSSSPWTNYSKVAGQNWMNETSGNWVKNSYTINTGDNTSMLIKWTSERSGDAGEILLDAIQLVEVKEASFDGYITNGDFETGKTTPWDIYSSTAVTAEAAKNGDYGMMLSGGGAGYGGIANQNFTVEIGKTYTVRFDMKVVNAGVNVQVKNGGSNVKSGYISKTEWATYSYDFTATATNSNLNFCGSGISGTDVAYLDNVMVYEKVEQSNDGYIVNGTFDTGVLTPWYNLWNSCPTAEVILGGKDSTFALHVVSGQWKHVRLVNIAVEPNTNYKVTVWAKNSKNMSLLVKGQSATGSATGDVPETGDINNVALTAGDEWTQFTNEFNSGDHNYILVSLMGTAVDGAEGTFDTIVMEKAHTCEIVELERVEAGCETEGYVKYGCECGEGVYTEPIYPQGHTYDVIDHKDATCGAAGYNTFSCVDCGDNYTITIDALDHAYDNEYDVDCNACGEIRVTDYNVVTSFDGNSVSEDVEGLAFKFDIKADIAIAFERISEIDYANSYIGDLKLVAMGAVASNNGSATILDNLGDQVIDIPARWLCNLVEGEASFAVRIVELNADFKKECTITARPYVIYEDAEGTQITIYGEEQAASYNGVLNG